MATDVPNPNFQQLTERSDLRDLLRNARDTYEWAVQVKRSIDDGIDGGTP